MNKEQLIRTILNIIFVDFFIVCWIIQQKSSSNDKIFSITILLILNLAYLIIKHYHKLDKKDDDFDDYDYYGI